MNVCVHIRQSFRSGLILLVVGLGLSACGGMSDEQAAEQRVSTAAEMVAQHRYEAALQQLDSVHSLYPRQVAQRRRAKALKDSIVYLQAQHTLRYADSLLQPLFPQADKLLKEFRFAIHDQYEDHGHYVHRLLQTGSNTSRCFLQAYVTDDRKTLLKSYYYGSYPIHQVAVSLSSADQQIEQRGPNHIFEVEGWHEILTLEDDQALEVLNFISSHLSDRIRVTALGEAGSKKSAAYYLNDNEKQALDRTYQLGLLMYDIAQLEEQVRISTQRIKRYEAKQTTNPQ